MTVVFIAGEPAAASFTPYLNELHREYDFSEVLLTDQPPFFAQSWAKQKDIPWRYCPPKWDTTGAVNLLVAFHGSEDEIEKAKAAGIPWEDARD